MTPKKRPGPPLRRDVPLPLQIVDLYEKTGRSGPMAFVVRETAVTDRRNELVVTMRQVTVVRL